MIRRTLLASVAGALAASALAAPALAADSGTAVCNEAENSFRGGYTVSGGIVDPVPPAFLRGSQMRVGQGHGEGLLNAAQHSPALRECGVPGTGDDGSGDGGNDGGGGIGST